MLLTASIGSGHIKATEAIEEALREILPQADITTVDFMSRQTSWVHWLMKKIYLIMLDFVPNLYDVFYKISGGASGGSLAQSAFAVIMQPVADRIIRAAAPDVVICTHPFPEGAASLWKKRHDSPLPLVVVMTDYSLHQIWLYPRVEAYFMATEAMRQEMIAKAFSGARLHAAGIPVDMSLQGLPGKAALRDAYGLPQHNPVILLMGGGLGLGGIKETLLELEKIPQPLTLLVIAGRNERLLEEVRKCATQYHHLVKVWGFTDKAHELMGAADLLITKPGALTISEAFVLGLPMLLHDPIPGPEMENAVYATKHGAAVWLHPGEKLAPAVQELLAGDCLKRMSVKAGDCARPAAAMEIAHCIAAMLAGKK
ncbi:MAG: glycosyltransferase [Selenomonadaceae bacterium]|nr:glycosyltransferase [Selenomonadaceae bacterium]